MMFNSEKAVEIINEQTPIDPMVVGRVKKALAGKGVVLDQSEELDDYLVFQGKEAITFSDGRTIIIHTNASASGFYEELIHYGQIKSGRAIEGNKENNLLMEIEAQERLLKYRKAYRITHFETEVLTNNLNHYRKQLQELKNGGS